MLPPVSVPITIRPVIQRLAKKIAFSPNAFAKALRVSSDEILGLKETDDHGLLKDRRFLRRLQRIEKLSKRDKQLLLGTLDKFLTGVA